jgi:hypothetical protein
MIPKSILNRLAAVEDRMGAKAPVGYSLYFMDAPFDFPDAGDWLRSQGHDMPGNSIIVKFIDAHDPHCEPRLREIRRPGCAEAQVF